MLTYRTGVAGGQAAAGAMADHLLQQTLPEQQMTLAAYYACHQEQTAEALAAGMGSVPIVRDDLNPALAKALGLEGGGLVDRQGLTNILSGLSADGEVLPGGDRRTITYADFTFSAPKSVSVAWMAAGTEAERQSIAQAVRTANDRLMHYVEREIGIAGLGDGRSKGEERGEFAWVSVAHYTARPTLAITRPDPTTGIVDTEIVDVQKPGGLVPGDPQLHVHNIVPNLMVTDSGRFVAMNRDLLADRVHEFGAVGQAFLAAELEAIGISTALDERTHLLTLPCIPDEVCREFSKRTEQAEDAARQIAKDAGHDWDTLDADRKIALLKGRAQAGRQGKGDDLGDTVAWKHQIEQLGWKHESAVTYGPPAPPLFPEQRHEAAYGVARTEVDPELQKRAVISKGDLRLAAARGLIASGGARHSADIDTVADRMTAGTVLQHGRDTRLMVREIGHGRQKITTELHVDQEREVMRLARSAAADTSRALTSEQIETAVQASGLDFSSEHGKRQREMIEHVGTGPALTVFVAAAGAGKTKGILPPLVDAWKVDGRDVWGATQAWRQTHEFESAGIDRLKCRALQPLLDGLADGRTKLTANSVVVLDELSQVGTRQLLDLMQHRERTGFQLVLTGGERQAQSIEAGPVIELLRKAVGDEAIPEILTTVRQQSEREREIASLFSAGSETATTQAISMLRQDGHAELVPGSYRAAVSRVADLYLERRDANRADPDYTVTISAPTNRDARNVSSAVRERLQARGEVGRDETAIQGTDGRGDLFGFSVAAGDRVRLYQRTRGIFTDERGRRHAAHIGDNGSVLRVVEVVRDQKAGGLRLETEAGKVGFVSWSALRDPGTQRLKLSLGYCMTVDSAQGLTSDEHVTAMPSGSASLQAFKAYSSASRHRVTHWLVGSHGAEKLAAEQRRPQGVRDPISLDDCWANVSRNLARAPMKELATDAMAEGTERSRAAVGTFQNVLRRQEHARQIAQPPSRLRSNVRAHHVQRGMAPVASVVRERAPAIDAAERAVAEARAAVRQERIERTAAVVTAGALDEGAAFEALKEKVIGTGPVTAPPDPKRGLVATYGWMVGAAKSVAPDDALDALLEAGREKHGSSWDWSGARDKLEPALWRSIEKHDKAERSARETAENELRQEFVAAVRDVQTLERRAEHRQAQREGARQTRGMGLSM